MNYKKHFLKNKNFKLGYYINTMLNNLIPDFYFQSQAKHIQQQLSKYSDEEQQEILNRLYYYCPLDSKFNISPLHPLSKKTLHKPDKSKVYYYDLRKYLKYFDCNKKFLYKPGDNISLLQAPHFVKSRPIAHSNNEIILKLNAIRHFNFIKDDIKFEEKKDLLFGRLAVYQDIRKRFFNTHFNNPLCDIGDVAIGTTSNWLKPKVSINEHLKYKFILALEGNDVATNLKWIMSSNSIAVMPKPQYETWFMEGRLVPNVHYICIKDDFSDLNQVIEYYIKNPEKALEIIKNANQWVQQFKDKQKELLLNLLVIEKYFSLTY